MTAELRLVSGRLVSLKELHMRATYDGLLEGVPTVEINLTLIKRTLADPAHRAYGAPPLLLHAPQTPVTFRGRTHSAEGRLATLPPVAVVARFTSLKPTAGEETDASGLSLLWYQDDFGFPPAPDLLARLRAVDWDRHAVNYWF